MDANEYQKLAIVTDGTTTKADRLANAVLGLAGEAGELAKLLVDSGWDGSHMVKRSLKAIAAFGSFVDHIKKASYHGHDAQKTIRLLNEDRAEIHAVMNSWIIGPEDFDESPEFKPASLTSLDESKFGEELGDAQWYVGQAATGIGWDLGIVMGGNLKKLKARYPDGFSAERSRNRAAPAPLSTDEQLLERIVDTYYRTIKPVTARWVIGKAIYPRVRALRDVHGDRMVQVSLNGPKTLMGLPFRMSTNESDELGIEDADPASRTEHRLPFPPNVTVNNGELTISWETQPHLGYQVEVKRFDGSQWVYGTIHGNVRYPETSKISNSPPMAVRVRSVLRSDLRSFGPWSEWAAVPAQPKLLPAPELHWNNGWLAVSYPLNPEGGHEEVLLQWPDGTKKIRLGEGRNRLVNWNENFSTVSRVAYRYVYLNGAYSLWSEWADVPPLSIKVDKVSRLGNSIEAISAGTIRGSHIGVGDSRIAPVNWPLVERNLAALGITADLEIIADTLPTPTSVVIPPDHTTPERWIVTADKPELRATVRHRTEDGAIKEAQRLATAHPGSFQVWQLVGSWERSTPPLVWHKAAPDSADPTLEFKSSRVNMHEGTKARNHNGAQSEDEDMPF